MEEVQESKPEVKAEKPKKESIFARLKNKITQYKRVIDVSRKPDREEFTSSAKVAAIGILLMGFVGFIIYMVYFLITAILV